MGTKLDGGLQRVAVWLPDWKVQALQQRKAEYGETRRQPDGSDTCGSCSDSDAGRVVELVVGSVPPALERDGVVAVRVQ